MIFTLQRKHLTIVQIHKVYELKAVSERVPPFLLYRKDLVTLKCESFPIKQKRSARMRTPKQRKMSQCDASAAREFASELFVLMEEL